jgi:hypothetical protein
MEKIVTIRVLNVSSQKLLKGLKQNLASAACVTNRFQSVLYNPQHCMNLKPFFNKALKKGLAYKYCYITFI